MKLAPSLQIALSTALLAAPALQAGTDTWFTPLTQSAPIVTANGIEETGGPWTTPEGILQNNRVSMREVEDAILSPGQSIVRVPGAGTSACMIDMMAFNKTASHIFLPHETPTGAGVSRYDIYANKCEVIFAGDATGNWANDYGAFDPCRWTPNGTLFLGEEWSGEGRVIEILNPMADVADIQFRELNSIANVSHEGINFSNRYRNTIYFIDENNSGSIYKFVMKRTGNYTVGQTFVLSVNAFASTGGVASQNWNSTANLAASRTGPATWVPLTDRDGNPLPGIPDPFQNGPTGSASLGGRAAADAAGGTPYGRPEDATVARLANGNEVLYVTTTSENAVISIEILTPGTTKVNGTAIVRTFASRATPFNSGFDATTGTLDSPDNLALDAAGNIYVIEDSPNSGTIGGDIWFARDVDNDGVAESLDHFMTLGIPTSEATGMIFNPARPTEFWVAVQHPASTDLNAVPNGLGDAVWSFDVSNVSDENFVKALKRGRYRFISNQ